MKILIDTNVIIDFLLSREPFQQAAARILTACAKRELTGYLAFHSVPNIWYVLRKVPENKRRAWLLDICSFLQIVGVSHSDVVKAIEMRNFADFEDCLQDRCAESVGANYIVTRNVQDFAASVIPAITPTEFWQKIYC